jgi:predicted RecB family nuclease
MPQQLSKTRFVAGCQCHDLLWWTVHEPDAPELVPDMSLEDRFEQGHQVGELARSYVPGGVLIDLPHDAVEQRLAASREALAAGAPAVYEATFVEDSVFVAVDILERVEGGYNLIEVKSTTSVKDEHIPDAAVQTHVLRKAGMAVLRVELMHLNRECRYPDLSNLFVREDVTAKVEDVLPGIPGEIEGQIRTIQGDFPAVGFGVHCLTGRDCPFHDRCWPAIDARHVLTLYRTDPAIKWSLLERGIDSIVDLPPDVKLNKQAERQVRAVTKGKMVIGPGLAEALEPFSGRLAHLDFETVSLAIPVWDGCGPWHQMPVQFSCLVEVEPGCFEHHEFLAESGADCRSELAAALVESCRGADAVVAYNSGFERRCIRMIAEAVPERAAELGEIGDKLIDPLTAVRNYVYHPRFLGSFSLKSVLPALVPDLAYDDLVISQGDVASLYLSRLLFRPEMIPESKRPVLRRDLLEYCKRDTWATVRLVERLRQLADRAHEVA